jgi:hypothetical protein
MTRSSFLSSHLMRLASPNCSLAGVARPRLSFSIYVSENLPTNISRRFRRLSSKGSAAAV